MNAALAAGAFFMASLYFACYTRDPVRLYALGGVSYSIVGVLNLWLALA